MATVRNYDCFVETLVGELSSDPVIFKKFGDSLIDALLRIERSNVVAAEVLLAAYSDDRVATYDVHYMPDAMISLLVKVWLDTEDKLFESRLIRQLTIGGLVADMQNVDNILRKELKNCEEKIQKLPPESVEKRRAKSDLRKKLCRFVEQCSTLEHPHLVRTAAHCYIRLSTTHDIRNLMLSYGQVDEP